MQVIIPMAGYGTRMRPHTYSRPKPLVNVAGQPMLKHLLDPLLAQLEIDEFIFIVGYLGEQVKEWVAETYDIKATYVVQDELIGQAHAIHLSRQHLHGPALLLFSDTLFDADLSVIKDFTGDGLAFVKEVDDPRRFGVVALNDEGRIVQFVEKPDSMENKLAVIGMYYLRDSAQMLHAVDTLMARKQMTRGEFYLADAYQIMVEEGADFRTQHVEFWLDCGTPEAVLESNQYLLENRLDNSASLDLPTVAVIPPVYVHPDAQVENSVVGPYAAISAGCRVSDSVIRNSIIDQNSVVSASLLNRSLVGQNAYVAGRFQSLNVGDATRIEAVGQELNVSTTG
jgi:glucose-1-phosphate thymidylyltransferase